VIEVSEPTFSSYLLRVGGVAAVFTIAILVTAEFFPGYEGYVVIAISGLGVFVLAAKEALDKKNRAKNKS
jgi:hypothetical protein